MKVISLILISLAAYAFAAPAPAPAAHNCMADVIHHIARRAEGEQVEWGYEGTNGPSYWGKVNKTCAVGKHQSPINLVDPSLLTHRPLTFNYPSLVLTTLTFTNTGHTVQVTIPDSVKATIVAADGLTYRLKQFHFHTPSEHHVDEKYYPLEVHFVHSTDDGKLAVVGMFFQMSTKPNAWLHQLVRA
ncbi:hypothetical protein HK104_006618, partial [Borealophlyctis nickersoniae]